MQNIQAVSVIPNCHTQDLTGRPLVIGSIIDIDPSRFSTDEQRSFIQSTMTEFLNQRQFSFSSRLSGSSHKGFHELLEFEVDKPFDLITNIASPQNYFTNYPVKIIINSLRESILALMLDYLRFYKSDGILDIATLEPDPYKIRLDLSKTAFKVGRRSIYSMHKGTHHVVIPLPCDEPLSPDLLSYYHALSSIDQAFAHSDEFHEKIISQSQRSHNTALLQCYNEENSELWEAYHKSPNKKKFLQTMMF